MVVVYLKGGEPHVVAVEHYGGRSDAAGNVERLRATIGPRWWQDMLSMMRDAVAHNLLKRREFMPGVTK